MAEGAFTRDMLDECAPEMRLLLAWHAAEEIEHRAVAFDVLQKVDPSYALRITGLVFATLALGAFWFIGARTLARQDGLGLLGFWREVRSLPKRETVVRRVFVRGIREYLRRNFHPSDNSMDHLAATWFTTRGMSLPEARNNAA